MNLHNIKAFVNEILYWVPPSGRHRPCRYPEEPARNHHSCPTDLDLRQNVIYCECPICRATGWAHYLDNRHRTFPVNGRFYDTFYCIGCNEGNCPPMPRVDAEGYPV
jgi:hypothetical protein